MRRWRWLHGLIGFLFILTTTHVGVSAAPSTPLFRVFLTNGTALVCWGEYARVGDRLVLTVPVGTGARTAYEFVSIPIDKIDLVRTERYAESVRAAQFAATRGRAEFAELSDRLSAQLSALAMMPDPKTRLASAEQARQQLLDWAASSHGYKSKEVQQMLQMFDSAIVDLRAAAGESRFSINLSVDTMPPAPVGLRAAPTAAETARMAIQAAAVADSQDVRRTLLERARAVAASLPNREEKSAKIKATIDRELAAAMRLEITYRRLDHDIRELAAKAVERGDVVAIDALRERVLKTDRLLGRQRKDDVAALLESLDREKDAAAQQRLVLDHWEALRSEIVAYQKESAGLVKALDGLAPVLTAIHRMSGPPLTEIVTAERQTKAVSALYANLVTPESVAVAHSLLGLAVEQADQAVQMRHRAVETRELAKAKDASALAADAIERLNQAKAALATALKPPKAVR